MSYLKKIVRNTGSNILFKMLTMLLGFVSLPLIIHNVGIEEYGLLALSRSILGYFVIFNIGFPTGVTKYIAQYLSVNDQDNVNRAINASIVFYMLIAFVILFGVMIFLYFDGVSAFNITPENYDTAYRMILYAGIWGTIAWPLNNILEGIFAGYQEFPKLNYGTSSGIIFSYVVTIILAYYGQHIIVIQLGQFAADAVRWVIQYYLLRKFVNGYKFSLGVKTYKMFRRIMSFSTLIFIQKLFTNLAQRSDNVLIGIFLPVSYITIYTVVLKGYHVIRTLMTMANTALAPLVSELDSKKETRILNEIVFRGSRYVNLILGIIVVTAFFMLPSFINLYVGEDFIPYAVHAQVMALTLFLSHTRLLLVPYSIGVGKIRVFTWITVVTNLAQFLTSLLLIYLIGFEGIIISYIVRGLVRSILEYIYLFPALEISPLNYLKNVDLVSEVPIIIFGLVFFFAASFLDSLSQWWSFFLSAGVVSLILCAFTLMFLVKKEELTSLYSKIRMKAG